MTGFLIKLFIIFYLPLSYNWKYNTLLRCQVGVRISEGVQKNKRLWCNGSMMDSKPIGQGSRPWGRAKRNYGVSVVCHAGLKIQRLRFDSVWFHKKNSMNENVKMTFEERLEGWKNRMTLARTIARIIAVIAQILITYFLISK